MDHAAKKPAALRVIIAYKLAKAGVQLVLAGVVLYGARHGMAAKLERLAHEIQHHTVNALSIRLGTLLVRLTSLRGGLWRVGLALVGDGLFTAFEGWALLRGYRWAPWLVVMATASFVPFELFALARHPRVGRFILLAVNLAIVVYLAWRARREQRSEASGSGQANRRPWRGSTFSGSA